MVYPPVATFVNSPFLSGPTCILHRGCSATFDRRQPKCWGTSESNVRRQDQIAAARFARYQPEAGPKISIVLSTAAGPTPIPRNFVRISISPSPPRRIRKPPLHLLVLLSPT